jgi:hypothetical protein
MMDGQDLIDVEPICDYKRVVALRYGGTRKTTESSPETARGHDGALDIDVFTKIEGGGSGQPYPVVMVARGGLQKASNGSGSQTGLNDGVGSLWLGSVSRDSSYDGGWR